MHNYNDPREFVRDSLAASGRRKYKPNPRRPRASLNFPKHPRAETQYNWTFRPCNKETPHFWRIRFGPPKAPCGTATKGGRHRPKIPLAPTQKYGITSSARSRSGINPEVRGARKKFNTSRPSSPVGCSPRRESRKSRGADVWRTVSWTHRSRKSFLGFQS
jgi:hypothetical protein